MAEILAAATMVPPGRALPAAGASAPGAGEGEQAFAAVLSSAGGAVDEGTPAQDDAPDAALDEEAEATDAAGVTPETAPESVPAEGLSALASASGADPGVDLTAAPTAPEVAGVPPAPAPAEPGGGVAPGPSDPARGMSELAPGRSAELAPPRAGADLPRPRGAEVSAAASGGQSQASAAPVRAATPSAGAAADVSVGAGIGSANLPLHAAPQAHASAGAGAFPEGGAETVVGTPAPVAATDRAQALPAGGASPAIPAAEASPTTDPLAAADATAAQEGVPARSARDLPAAASGRPSPIPGPGALPDAAAAAMARTRPAAGMVDLPDSAAAAAKAPPFDAAPAAPGGASTPPIPSAPASVGASVQVGAAAAGAAAGATGDQRRATRAAEPAAEIRRMPSVAADAVRPATPPIVSGGVNVTAQGPGSSAFGLAPADRDTEGAGPGGLEATPVGGAGPAGTARAEFSPRSAEAAPPPMLARQIAAAVREGGAEVQLDPIELGRVAISIRVEDGITHVTILAERPETTELMRRHTEMLHRELADSGIAGARLSFDGSGAQSRHASPGPRAALPGVPASGPDMPPATATARARASGRTLDLRV